MNCRTCGAEIPEGARFCEHDGTPVAAPTAGNAPPANADAGRRPGCACGQLADDGEGYCAACGEPITHVDTDLSPALGATTDIGLVHKTNQDALAVAAAQVGAAPAFVLVVCDGVSAAQGSERSSRLAAACIRDHILAFLADETLPQLAPEALVERSSTAIETALHAADAAVRAMPSSARDVLDPPTTTAVAALAIGDALTISWAGDSRAYSVAPDGDVQLLTHDDSWINEEVDQGAMDLSTAMADPDAHAITNWLGIQQDETGAEVPATVHVAAYTAPPGALLVLCSDGLWNYLGSPDHLARLIHSQPGA